MAKKAWQNGRRYVGPAVAAASLALIGALLFRSYRDQPPPVEPEPAPVEVPAPPPDAAPAPAAPPAMGRANLIAAATAAAAAYAAAPVDAPTPSPLVGRRFTIRLPFGCDGPARADETRSAYWTRGTDPASVRIVVRPENWTASALAQEVAGPEGFEAVEGFWISRPWLLSEACPPGRGDPLASGAASPSAETIGLAMFFEAGGSRVARREERPYELVIRTPPEVANPAPQGFRLILDGRVTGYQNGAAFRCRSGSEDQRPVCVARVELDKVAVEDPASGRVVGTWDVGQLSASRR